MAIFGPNPALGNAGSAQSDSISALTAKHQKEIDVLKAKIKDLEDQLLRSRVKEDVGFKIADDVRKYAAGVERRSQQLESRNAKLENPKGSNYSMLSWSGRILFCIKKLKRPLRFQEIMQELGVMDRLHRLESWLTEKTISVTLSGMAKDGRLRSYKLRGTRGNFYALNEWANEKGELNEKMRRALW